MPTAPQQIMTTEWGLCSILRVDPVRGTLVMDANDATHWIPPAPATPPQAPTPPAQVNGVQQGTPPMANGMLWAAVVVMGLYVAGDVWQKYQAKQNPTPAPVQVVSVDKLVRQAVRVDYPSAIETELVDKLIAANNGKLTIQEVAGFIKTASPLISEHTWGPVVDMITTMQNDKGVFAGDNQKALDAALRQAKKELQACRK